MVVFPEPDGAEMTNMSPRGTFSLHVLDLLAHLLELRLCRHHEGGDPGVGGLVPRGVELNTAVNKSAHAGISTLVVAAKTELEMVREQIQNVE